MVQYLEEEMTLVYVMIVIQIMIVRQISVIHMKIVNINMIMNNHGLDLVVVMIKSSRYQNGNCMK